MYNWNVVSLLCTRTHQRERSGLAGLQTDSFAHSNKSGALDRFGVSYLGHATVVIELDGYHILTDPLLRRRTAHLRRPEFGDLQPAIEDIDVVVISHMHWDHLDVPSLRMLSPTVPVIAPTSSSTLLAAAGLRNVTEVRPGDRMDLGTIQIEATPANHDGGRPPFGPSGEAVGFLFQGSSSVYFAGDTDIFDEMADIAPDLDLALLPVWGWGPTLGAGHLDPRRAAESLDLLRPRHAIPIHWGTLCPIGLKWTRPRFLTEPPREFARLAENRASGVNVHKLEPGDRQEFALSTT